MKPIMEPGDLVEWLDPDWNTQIGLVVSNLNLDGYYDVLIAGKVEFCHKSHLSLLNENR